MQFGRRHHEEQFFENEAAVPVYGHCAIMAHSANVTLGKRPKSFDTIIAFCKSRSSVNEAISTKSHQKVLR